MATSLSYHMIQLGHSLSNPKFRAELLHLTDNGPGRVGKQLVHFAVVAVGLTATDYEAMPDVFLFPSAIFAGVFAYNIPELVDNPQASAGESLVLPWDVLADIYLGHIAIWNHPNITNANPTLAPYLHDNPIIVVIKAGPAILTSAIIAGAVSAAVPGFSAQVPTHSLQGE